MALVIDPSLGSIARAHPPSHVLREMLSYYEKHVDSSVASVRSPNSQVRLHLLGSTVLKASWEAKQI